MGGFRQAGATASVVTGRDSAGLVSRGRWRLSLNGLESGWQTPYCGAWFCSAPGAESVFVSTVARILIVPGARCSSGPGSPGSRCQTLRGRTVDEEVPLATGTYELDSDILILGGGSAGAMAAIWAKQMDPKQKVIVFEKGDIKYAGSIPRGMDALNIVAVPGIATPSEYVESIRIKCEGVVDDAPSHALVSRTWDLVKTLSSWGIYFPRDEHGNYEVLRMHPKGRFALTMVEPELKPKLVAQLVARGCKVLNRVMAVELLLEDGRVAGAIGVNVRTGEMVVCRAKAVILSAGGAARFGLPPSGYLYGTRDYPGNSGDGYMLAYRAGAKVTGFECTQQTYIVKDINVPLFMIVHSRGAKILDASNQEITESPLPISTLLRRHEEGHGPMRFNMQHLPEERIREIEDILFSVERPVQKRYFAGRGIDFRTGEIELWPTDFGLCGGHGNTGVVVNERAESTLPGLYVAGDNAGVPQGHLSGAFVYGQIAAESATIYARSVAHSPANPRQVGRIQEKLASISQRRGGVGVEEIEYKVRRTIDDYVTPPKNAYKLQSALSLAGRLTRDLEEQVNCQTVRDLAKVLEVENIIGCAVLSARASLERRESRWGRWHRRADYPRRNDDEWLKHVDCQRGESDLDVQVSYREIKRMEVQQ